MSPTVHCLDCCVLVDKKTDVCESLSKYQYCQTYRAVKAVDNGGNCADGLAGLLELSQLRVQAGRPTRGEELPGLFAKRVILGAARVHAAAVAAAAAIRIILHRRHRVF